ncbi:CBS domain-containing protein [Kaistella palustris]|uniref:CBS domain-containing protein n=1 Tax=Kaistella palustris TaxID=493376 RepID=UPI0004247287|nr:CBS domain-containing protein [Kaistella palustris]
MFIKDYISKDFPAFNSGDLIEEANDLAKEFGYSHVFVKKKGIYQGALSQPFLEESPEGTLASLEMHYERFALYEDGNILDSINLFNTFSANVIPVITKAEKYVGYLSCDDIFSEFSKYPLFSEAGAIMIVQVTGHHYSFTEIAKIVETNNGRIFGCYVSLMTEDYVQITVKMTSDNLSSVDETFRRYGYTVIHKYYDDEKDELLKDRFGFFQKYMEI